jgi:hypothetical protein
MEVEQQDLNQFKNNRLTLALLIQGEAILTYSIMGVPEQTVVIYNSLINNNLILEMGNKTE